MRYPLLSDHGRSLGIEELEIEEYSYEGTFGVGYAVTVFIPSTESPYIRLARMTIESYVTNKSLPDIPDYLPPEMMDRRGNLRHPL